MKPAAPVTNIVRFDIQSPRPVRPAPGLFTCRPGHLAIPVGRLLPEGLQNHTKAGKFSADRHGPRLALKRTPIPDAPDCAFLAENTRFCGAAVPGATQG